jgi:hypothetical protein
MLPTQAGSISRYGPSTVDGSATQTRSLHHLGVREGYAILHMMKELTRRLWEEQDRHPGDRLRLFATVGDFTGDTSVLYPGSFVDVSASFVFSPVTFVDNDGQAARFFADTAGVYEIISSHRRNGNKAEWRFLHADYRSEIDLAHRSFGLLISLYAGFVSDHCTRYLQPGGWLLVNPNHGDAAMASIDPRYRLAAVINARSDRYKVSEADLDSYMIPKRPTKITPELLHRTGRGIAYTRSPFAYLFQHQNN